MSVRSAPIRKVDGIPACGHLARVLRRRVVNGKGDVVALEEGRDPGAVGVDVDGDDDEVAVAVLIVEPLHDGELQAAGPAPGGPHVQQNDVALELREADGPSVRAGEFEVGKGAIVLGDDSRGAPGEQECQRQKSERASDLRNGRFGVFIPMR